MTIGSDHQSSRSGFACRFALFTGESGNASLNRALLHASPADERFRVSARASVERKQDVAASEGTLLVDEQGEWRAKVALKPDTDVGFTFVASSYLALASAVPDDVVRR